MDTQNLVAYMYFKLDFKNISSFSITSELILICHWPIQGCKAKNVKPVMTEQTQSVPITSKPDWRVVPTLCPR